MTGFAGTRKALLHLPRDVGTLNSSSACANNRHALIGEFVEPTEGTTTGVVIIPTAGVERVPGVFIDADMPGNFGRFSGPFEWITKRALMCHHDSFARSKHRLPQTNPCLVSASA